MSNKKYWHNTFLEIYEDLDAFKTDLASYLPTFDSTMSLTAQQQSTIYYLLVARYGENPIANNTEDLFKTKLFARIYAYAPLFFRKRQIQDTLRSLTEDEIRLGSKQIYNHAFNPSTTPTTATLEELEFINDQNTANNKKGKLDGYMLLWSMLSSNEVEDFLKKFKSLFQFYLDREVPYWYNEEEGE
jgi:hypothetical protein